MKSVFLCSKKRFIFRVIKWKVRGWVVHVECLVKMIYTVYLPVFFYHIKYPDKTCKIFKSCYQFIRWFKYDRDCLCVNKPVTVPVIFERTCRLEHERKGPLRDIGVDGTMWLKRMLKWLKLGLDVSLRLMAPGEFMHTGNEYDYCVRGGKYLDHASVC